MKKIQIDNSNFELFDMPTREDTKDGNGSPARGSHSLVIHPRSGSVLSKEEKQFNRLTREIADLQRRIGERTVELDKILDLYHARLYPLRKEGAELDIEFARLIATAARTMRFGKNQVERVRYFIRDLFENAFVLVEPDPDTIALYDAWAEVLDEEEKKETLNAMKISIEEYAREMFGMDLDISEKELSELDGSPESYARFLSRLIEQMSGKSWEDMPPERPRRKTAKQLAAEERKRTEALAEARNTRAIYLSLAKALHPDLAVDNDDRTRREQLMRQVTAAYQAGDMTALLRLEMEWVAREDGGLHRMPEETLRSMISALKTQAAVLRDELRGLPYHPRYELLERYAEMSTQRAINAIERDMRAYDDQIDNNRALLESIGPKPTKKTIMELVDAAEEAASQDYFFEDIIREYASGLKKRHR